MNFFDIIFHGWYQILNRTIYSTGTEKGGIGPKEHAFFTSFLFHGINLWTIARFVMAHYFKMDVPFYLSLSLAVLVFVVGYMCYYGRRTETVSVGNASDRNSVLFVLVALAYVVVSVFFMFKVGDYVKVSITQ